MDQAELCRELKLSRSSVYRLRRIGYIRGGVHFRRCGPGERAPLAFNLPLIEKALGLFLGR